MFNKQIGIIIKLGFSLHLFCMGLIKNTTPIARGTRCIYFSLEKRFVPLVYPPHFCRHPSTKNCPKVPSRRLIFASLALKRANIFENRPRPTPSKCWDEIYFLLQQYLIPLVYPPHFCRHRSTKNWPKVPSRRLIFASLALKQANISESEPRPTPCQRSDTFTHLPIFC